MLGFVHRLHREDRATPAPAAVPRHSEFDESLDEEGGPIKIHEAGFRASDVLFGLEPATDRIHAAEFGANGEDADTAGESLP
jgi:hypothetical protein